MNFDEPGYLRCGSPETSICLHATFCILLGVLVYNVFRFFKKQPGKKHQKFCYIYRPLPFRPLDRVTDSNSGLSSSVKRSIVLVTRGDASQTLADSRGVVRPKEFKG